MGSRWRKIKVALGLNSNRRGPRNLVADNNDDEVSPPPPERRSDSSLLSPPGDRTSASLMPVSNRLRLSKSLSRSSSKNTCSICLASMIRGDGHAIFTAECSHSFHFQCITSNVKHGNQICPVCRANWKEIPFQGQPRISPVPVYLPQNNNFISVMRPPPPHLNNRMHVEPVFQFPEPSIYNDDESLDKQTDTSNICLSNSDNRREITLKSYTEVPAVPRSSTLDNFSILLHIKAPCSNSSRVPVDFVTVLDISGSMSGTKLALLKRAMGFMIQNLGPNDRLAVIAFSSTARRLFPLRRMSEIGRQQAIQAINSLVSSGGTNIADGLRKGAQIMEDRRDKNPVASIILLSDGQDTYTVCNSDGTRNQDYERLLPLSIRKSPGFKIPVHAFGFGADHDASSMHSISEISGGTFSFIETEEVIQDTFAQCIGGLLSVVVNDLHVKIECVDPRVFLRYLKVGSYPNHITPNQRSGSIDVGNLYADEERDFLISVNIPIEISVNETSMLMVQCVYDDPVMKESVTIEGEEVRITRTEVARNEPVSVEVDRQKNRNRAAEAMGQARAEAEKGDLAGAVSILESCRKVISETVSSRDTLCVALDVELKEMQDRLASRHVYESSGRAYILSGLSSHSWQRATARGDSMDGSSLVQAYQTPAMVDMVTRSQATLLCGPSAQRLI